jgi:hypothetical protein
MQLTPKTTLRKPFCSDQTAPICTQIPATIRRYVKSQIPAPTRFMARTHRDRHLNLFAFPAIFVQRKQIPVTFAIRRLVE